MYLYIISFFPLSYLSRRLYVCPNYGFQRQQVVSDLFSVLFLTITGRVYIWFRRGNKLEGCKSCIPFAHLNGSWLIRLLFFSDLLLLNIYLQCFFKFNCFSTGCFWRGLIYRLIFFLFKNCSLIITCIY